MELNLSITFDQSPNGYVSILCIVFQLSSNCLLCSSLRDPVFGKEVRQMSLCVVVIVTTGYRLDPTYLNCTCALKSGATGTRTVNPGAHYNLSQNGQ